MRIFRAESRSMGSTFSASLVHVCVEENPLLSASYDADTTPVSHVIKNTIFLVRVSESVRRGCASFVDF